MTPHRPATLFVIIAGLSVGGCAGQRPPAADATHAPTAARQRSEDPRAALARLAAAEAAAPGRRGEPLPPAPPGIDAAALAPVAADNQDALTPLASLLPSLRRPVPSPALPSRRPEGLARTAALRLYISGRSAVYRGDLPTAISDLQSATRLDPSATEPWEALGEAQLRAGQSRAASDSFARAIEAGSTDPLALLTGARAAEQRGDSARAAAILVQLVESSALTTDPALPYLAYTSLGQSLLDAGYLAAATDALTAGLDLPSTFDQQTRYREELADLYRRSAELWRSLGDASCRLGRYELALQAYGRAASAPSFDPGSVLPRSVYASLCLGRPAAAASIVVDELANAEAGVDARYVPLVRYLAANGGSAEGLLARAVEQVRAERPVPIADSAADTLARIAAAALPALPAEPARDILRRRLTAAPGSEAVLADLLATYAGEPPAAISGELVRLADQSPLHIPAIVGAAVRSGAAADPAALRAALASRGSSVLPRLLIAQVAALCDDDAQSLALLSQVERDYPRDAAVAAVAIPIHSGAGQWAETDRLLTVLREMAAAAPRDLPLQRALARAQASAQRLRPALDTLRAVIPAADAAVSPGLATDLAFAADLAAALGEPADAAALLRRATVADPFLEEPYLSLVQMHSDAGAIPDRAKLIESIRLLRDAVPSSRGLRLLRTQELLQGGQVSPALSTLLSLAREVPDDRAPFDVLGQVWPAIARPTFAGGASVISQGRAALGEILAQRPRAIWARIALAQLESAAGDPDHGLRILADPPAPVLVADRTTLARAAEDLRRAAGRATEADRYAVQRLGEAPPSIPNTVELAAILARTGSVTQAADLLRTRIPPGATLTSGQMQALAESLAVAIRDQPTAAVALAKGIADNGGRDNLATHRLWFQSVAAAGTSQDAIDLVKGLDARSLTSAVFGPFLRQSAASPGAEPTPSELAYTLGVLLLSRGGDAEAIPLYELALEYDPRHAMAANNLGYTLLEHGRDLDRAEQLLEVAHRAKPDDANVTDSIGWLRYTRGIIDDEAGADDGGPREGAVTLLRRATQQESGGSDGTILDHLGDALWIKGDRDEAARQWRLAELRARQVLSGSGRDRLAPAALSRLEALIRSTQEKQQAVAGGTEPAVAPRSPAPPRSSRAAPESP